MRTLLFSAAALLALTACPTTDDDSKQTSSDDSEVSSDCGGSVDEHLNYPDNDQGTFTESRTLCAGETHKFKLNTPSPPQCALSAEVTYEDGADVALRIYLENGDELQVESEGSSSPESAATTTDGGTMSVRVSLDSGEETAYDLTIVYEC